MLIVGYWFGIRSERRLSEEVHLNLAYRWFGGLGLEGDVLDHSIFSKARHDRFRESDLLRSFKGECEFAHTRRLPKDEEGGLTEVDDVRLAVIGARTWSAPQRGVLVTSSHVRLVTSSRRWPVRASSVTIGAKGEKTRGSPCFPPLDRRTRGAGAQEATGAFTRPRCPRPRSSRPGSRDRRRSACSPGGDRPTRRCAPRVQRRHRHGSAG